MSTSPTTPTPSSPAARLPLRLEMHDDHAKDPHGVWWPQSRDLQTEVADLVDHFPAATGRIDRLLFSRPDWDNSTVDGFGVRKIYARRGPVKVGSFPSDDTHLMVLTMSSRQRLRLVVVPSTAGADGERQLREIVEGRSPSQPAESA